MPTESKSRWLTALLVVAVVVPAAAAEKTDQPKPMTVVKQTTGADGTVVVTLSNGLTAIVQAVRTSPVVCVRAYVRAGGMYEREWLGAGVSHLLEHLVAKGAVHSHGPGGGGSPTGTRSRVAEIGGQSNAYTSLDKTCYYIAASSSKTMACVDLIADWLARPEIAEKDFQREHGVVQREQEMGKDNPTRQMWYAHAADQFRSHPAAVPVIGYAAPLRKLTLQDVKAYHGRMYVPQNMVFCVVGDVDSPAVIKRICKAFAGFERGNRPNTTLPPVPNVSSGRRTVVAHKTVNDTLVRMSFRTVDLAHADLYALDVLSYVLTTGRSSRLVRSIQRDKQLVTSIFSGSWTPSWGAGSFTIGYRAKPDKAAAAEKAILAELRLVIDKGVTPAEIERAKRQKIADHVHSQQTVESLSSTLATDYLSTGDAWFSSHYTDRIQAVTADQIRAAGRKYFQFDRTVVTSLVPQKHAATAAAAAKTVGKTAATRFALPNGLRVVLQPSDAVGLVAMTFVTQGGLFVETEKTNGLGTLMAELSVRGAGKRSAEEIAAFFDRAGGSISGKCGSNTMYWQATVLDDSAGGAMEILADVIQRPTFTAKELDILRPVLISRVKAVDEQWASQMQKFWRSKFFVGSPYRMLPSGRVAVIEKAAPKQIRAHHGKTVRPGHSVLTVYGRFDAATMRKQVERLFSPMAKGDETMVTVPAARRVKAGGEQHVLKTSNQVAAIMVAAPGMTVVDIDDRLAITVLDTIISGFRLPAGWLHRELRGKRLVYVVHAYNWAGMAPGAFITYAACQPDKAAEVIGIIRRNLKRASTYKPTQKEIDRAINVILTAELLENQSMSDLSMSAALDELYGLGYDYRQRLEGLYRKVKPADVCRVGRQYLAGDYVVTVTTRAPEMLKAKKSTDTQPGGPGPKKKQE